MNTLSTLFLVEAAQLQIELLLHACCKQQEQEQEQEQKVYKRDAAAGHDAEPSDR